MKAQDFHCPNCGGALRVEDISGATVRCQYCDSVLPVPSWLEEDVETAILYANDNPVITTLLDKGIITPNEAREMVLKECEPMSFVDRFTKITYNCGTDSASFAERFNEIGRKYGVECLDPHMYLADVHTTIEETDMGVLVRKDGFKLSKAIRKLFKKIKTIYILFRKKIYK